MIFVERGDATETPGFHLISQGRDCEIGGLDIGSTGEQRSPQFRETNRLEQRKSLIKRWITDFHLTTEFVQLADHQGVVLVQFRQAFCYVRFYVRYFRVEAFNVVHLI